MATTLGMTTANTWMINPMTTSLLKPKLFISNGNNSFVTHVRLVKCRVFLSGLLTYGGEDTMRADAF